MMAPFVQFPYKSNHMALQKKKTVKINTNNFFKDETIVDYDTTDEFGDLLIPAFLQHSYLHGNPPIKSLRSWQHQLLSSPEWEDRKNCVAVAPTSGGKTLIAEVAIAQLLEDEPYSKAIYTLPFVALAAEKTSEFEMKFHSFSVRPFYKTVGRGDFYRGSIGICTYEKAHSLLNSAIKGKYDHKIKLVIIDEVHMISDDSRGVALESLIMKLRSMKSPPRIIALTATLNQPDAENLAKKIGGFSFFSTQKNSNIRKYISAPGGELYSINKGLQLLFQAKSIKEDHDFLIPMVRVNLLKSQNATVLIFVNTRNDTKRIATFLLNHLNDQIDGLRQLTSPLQSIVTLRNELVHELAKSPAGLDPFLSKCILSGIACHHAGLLLEERKVIEKGMRNGSLSVVVATTTLSAGINIRSVSRVIIYSPYRKVNGKKMILSESLFAQMAGRCGRTEELQGDVITISRSQNETNEIFQHVSKPLPSIITVLSKNEQIDTYILQALSFGFASDFFTLKTFLKSSFNDTDEVVIKNSIHRLFQLNMIEDEKKCHPTNLGMAVSSANLSIEDGIDLNLSTNKLMAQICLLDDLHLIFLCTPSRTGVLLPSFKEEIWEEIFEKHSHVIGLITGKSIDQLRLIIVKSFSGYGEGIDPKERPLFEKIYGACVLSSLIEEIEIHLIEKKFKIDRGSIQMLQSSSSMFSGQATKFCEVMGFHPLAAALRQFTKRITFAVKSDIIDLMSIPSMRREIARSIFNHGYQTLSDVHSLSAEEIASMIPTGTDALSSDDAYEIASQIAGESNTLAEQLAILEDLEEKATWNKIKFSDSEDDF